jgi:MoaA/NifB/PqqE/SkfB family radical SAM enzyme
MPVKYWSFAGLLLTYWCSARCSCCYLSCGPEHADFMAIEDALRFWRQLVDASPHGCRIHLSGGEPFGDWPRLIDLCRQARAEGLGPLEKVETNAFWVTEEAIVADRLRQLDEAGMQKLVISADPYHQQFVPIARCRLAARVAEDVLGRARVQVRWRDWLERGCDTSALSERARVHAFTAYARGGRDRWSGRAAEALAPRMQLKSLKEVDDKPCREALLRSKHVHIDPAGRVMPGTCNGILVGQAGRRPLEEIWRRLSADHAGRTVVGILSARGPKGLLDLAESDGYVQRTGYAGKCHLCWDVRSFLVGRGLLCEELGPPSLYGVGPGSG